MATKTTATKLDITARESSHSRENRRLRRAGRVPGILYGGSEGPVPFSADERTLRHALAAQGAVLELSVDGGSGQPAVLKDAQRHPVRGDLLHVDLLRVDLTKTIHAVVGVVLVGGEDSVGVREGGILTHETRELNVEALPSDIPEAIEVDVSGLEVAGTLLLAEVVAPEGVTLLDDPEATVIASITAPSREEPAEDELETETAVVGEEAGEAEAGGEDADAGEAPADAE